jgi:hypothetical protein
MANYISVIIDHQHVLRSFIIYNHEQQEGLTISVSPTVFKVEKHKGSTDSIALMNCLSTNHEQFPDPTKEQEKVLRKVIGLELSAFGVEIDKDLDVLFKTLPF